MQTAAVALSSPMSGATTAGATATTLLASSNNIIINNHHATLLYDGYNLNSSATSISNLSKQQDYQPPLFSSPLNGCAAITAGVLTGNGVGNGNNCSVDSVNSPSTTAELAAAKVASPFASLHLQQQQSTGLNSPASTLTGSFSNFLTSQVPTIQHQHPHINDSDFPQLGGWTPSFANIGTGGIGLSSSSSSAAVAAAANNTYRSVAGAASPIVHGASVFVPHSTHSHQHQALFNRVADGSMHNHNHVMPRPYANLMREGTTTEFRIQNEDFPALPGSGSEQSTTHSNYTGGGGPLQSMKSLENSLMSATSAETASNIVCEKLVRSPDPSSHHHPNPKATAAATAAISPVESGKQQGIQTHPDGLVTNIPPNMLDDQFGMAGLLTFLRTIESDPSIVELALGHDLTALGLNLNSPKRTLYQSFGPWATLPCRVQDLDAKVPDDYLTNATIGQKLPNIKLNKLALDVLFYLFYNCPGEVYQVAAASELYARSWRYHMSEKVWLTRSSQANPPQEHTGSYEKSSYTVFDPIHWRLTTREMMLEYKQLEGKPNSVNSNGAVVSTPSSASGAGPMMQSAMSAYGADSVEGRK